MRANLDDRELLGPGEQDLVMDLGLCVRLACSSECFRHGTRHTSGLEGGILPVPDVPKRVLGTSLDDDDDDVDNCNGLCVDTSPEADVNADGCACSECDGDDDDGVNDCPDNCVSVANADLADSDGDDIGDACDNCPDDPNANQADGDADDVGNVCDNCPDDANAVQADADDDEVGEVCHNCPVAANADQADANSNGVGDACDVDLGAFADKLGTYTYAGQCPPGTTVQLLVVEGVLVLRGLPGNDDIPLVINGNVAEGDDVTAFDDDGHELTLTIQDGFLSLALFQPDTLGSCESTLTP